MKKLPLFVVVLLVALAGLWPQSMRGQGKQEAVVLYTDPRPGADTLALNVLFTVLDSSDQALPQEAIQFEAGGQAYGSSIAAVEARVAPATMPLKIALLIDASGSMSEEIGNVRQAAINFVRKTPPNAEIAVFKFSDEPELVQGFTKKEQIGLVENAILSITNRPPGTGNTCIYKAALAAINAANSGTEQSAGARPAVVLFTDGKDSQAGDCGAIKEEQVVTQARQSGPVVTQVHTIGLCAEQGCNAKEIDVNALRTLAEKTYASTKVGKLGELDDLFSTILSTLNNQWLASAEVKPKQGHNQITMTFNARINQLPAPISLITDFDSPRDYAAPPAKVVIASRTFDMDTNQYTVHLNVTNPEQVKQLTLVLRDATNNTVWQEPVQDIRAVMARQVPATQLKEGSEFFIDVKAIDVNGTEIKDEEGKTPSMKGTYIPRESEPISFEFALPPIYNREHGAFEITLSQVQSHKDAKLLYQGSITRDDSPVMEIPEGVWNGSDIVVALPATEVTALNNAQQPQKYVIKLTLADASDGTAATREKITTVIRPPRASLPTRIIQALTSPVVLGSMLVIVIVVAGVLVSSVSWSRKHNVPPPEPLYSGHTIVPSKSAERQPRPDPEPPDGATEIDIACPQPQLKIGIVATPEPQLNHGDLIKQFPCVIGRVNAAFLIQGDPKVSRQHVQLDVQDNRIVITDLESANGTALVVPEVSGNDETYIVKQKLERGASVEWDKQSLIRLGPNTLLELTPQGSLQDSGSPTMIHDAKSNRQPITG